jgi:Cu+-exporting ATPase
VEYDESVVSVGALHDVVVENGYQVLKLESAQDHKERARRELQSARQRAFLALLLAAPVAVLAMFNIELPWMLLGHNVSVWIQAVLGTAVILILGWQFHTGMLQQARALSANMDTLISLGTLAALLFSLWAMLVGAHQLYFETGAVITALILLGPISRPEAAARPVMRSRSSSSSAQRPRMCAGTAASTTSRSRRSKSATSF